MKETFATALKFTRRWEGGFVNDPADPGGATNLGVTQGTYNAWRELQNLARRDVKFITPLEAELIYKQRYWHPVNGDGLGYPLDFVAFDTAVNLGVGRTRKFLKEVANHPTSSLEKARRVIDLRVNHYYRLAKLPPPFKFRKFLNGWLNRVRDLKKEIGY